MKWYSTTGKDKDVVISSRVRFARNLENYPFPARMNEAAAAEVITKIREAFGDSYTYIDFSKLTPIETRAYVERHEVSADFAKAKRPHGLLTCDKNQVSVMLCEEDHMRIQSIISGLALEEAYAAACEADDLVDSSLSIAFDEKLGYLTQCPTNLGTGMRASVMMFLPAMTMFRHIGILSAQLQKLGLTIRGLYGEGSSNDGCIYQISNQITLGISEEETLGKLSDIISQIVAEERKFRTALSKNEALRDRIARAEGTLRYALRIPSAEFMTLYSDLRLGVALEVISGIEYEKTDELLVTAMPANLMIMHEKQNADENERDKLRAEYIRSSLA